jgi:hypothetical protein
MRQILPFLLSFSICAAQSTDSVGILAAPGGRYVFGQVSVMRRDQFLLDTQTGRLWALALDSNSNRVLESVMFVDCGIERQLPAPDATNVISSTDLDQLSRRFAELATRAATDAATNSAAKKPKP